MQDCNKQSSFLRTAQPTVTVARSNSNSTFSISCNSVGSPPTTIVWTKDENELTVDGSTIEALQSITDRGLSRYRNVLNINNQQPDDLVGAYTCVVTNALGSVGATLVLRGEAASLTILENCSSIKF